MGPHEGSRRGFTTTVHDEGSHEGSHGGSRFPVCDRDIGRVAGYENLTDRGDVIAGDVNGDQDRAGLDLAFDRLRRAWTERPRRSAPRTGCRQRGRRLHRARRPTARRSRSDQSRAEPLRWLPAPGRSAHRAPPQAASPRDRRPASRPAHVPAPLLPGGCERPPKCVLGSMPAKCSARAAAAAALGLGNKARTMGWGTTLSYLLSPRLP